MPSYCLFACIILSSGYCTERYVYCFSVVVVVLLCMWLLQHIICSIYWLKNVKCTRVIFVMIKNTVLNLTPVLLFGFELCTHHNDPLQNQKLMSFIEIIVVDEWLLMCWWYLISLFFHRLFFECVVAFADDLFAAASAFHLLWSGYICIRLLFVCYETLVLHNFVQFNSGFVDVKNGSFYSNFHFDQSPLAEVHLLHVFSLGHHVSFTCVQNSLFHYCSTSLSLSIYTLTELTRFFYRVKINEKLLPSFECNFRILLYFILFLIHLIPFYSFVFQFFLYFISTV